jgi:hypothetical protein
MKKRTEQKQSARHKTSAFTLSTRNYQLFGISTLIIILGYIALSKGPADSFWSLTLAPILLVIGYCVIVPIAIIYKERKKAANSITGD